MVAVEGVSQLDAMEVKARLATSEKKHWRDEASGGGVSFGWRAQFTVAWQAVCFEAPRTMMDGVAAGGASSRGSNGWLRRADTRRATSPGCPAVLACLWASSFAPGNPL